MSAKQEARGMGRDRSAATASATNSPTSRSGGSTPRTGRWRSASAAPTGSPASSPRASGAPAATPTRRRPAASSARRCCRRRCSPRPTCPTWPRSSRPSTSSRSRATRSSPSTSPARSSSSRSTSTSASSATVPKEYDPVALRELFGPGFLAWATTMTGEIDFGINDRQLWFLWRLRERSEAELKEALKNAGQLFRRLQGEMDESGIHTYPPGPWHAGPGAVSRPTDEAGLRDRVPDGRSRGVEAVVAPRPGRAAPAGRPRRRRAAPPRARRRRCVSFGIPERVARRVLVASPVAGRPRRRGPCPPRGRRRRGDPAPPPRASSSPGRRRGRRRRAWRSHPPAASSNRQVPDGRRSAQSASASLARGSLAGDRQPAITSPGEALPRQLDREPRDRRLLGRVPGQRQDLVRLPGGAEERERERGGQDPQPALPEAEGGSRRCGDGRRHGRGRPRRGRPPPVRARPWRRPQPRSRASGPAASAAGGRRARLATAGLERRLERVHHLEVPVDDREVAFLGDLPHRGPSATLLVGPSGRDDLDPGRFRRLARGGRAGRASSPRRRLRHGGRAGEPTARSSHRRSRLWSMQQTLSTPNSPSAAIGWNNRTLAAVAQPLGSRAQSSPRRRGRDWSRGRDRGQRRH